MKEIREQLERSLEAALSRLRRMDAAVALAELPGAIGDNSPFADEVDDIQASQYREMGFATRSILIERVHRLRVALNRLAEGEYGTCIECGERIAPARLRVMPEVETCVRCQDRLERVGRFQAVEAEVGAGDDED
jgi:DnaK suppressor protein